MNPTLNCYVHFLCQHRRHVNPNSNQCHPPPMSVDHLHEEQLCRRVQLLHPEKRTRNWKAFNNVSVYNTFKGIGKSKASLCWNSPHTKVHRRNFFHSWMQIKWNKWIHKAKRLSVLVRGLIHHNVIICVFECNHSTVQNGTYTNLFSIIKCVQRSMTSTSLYTKFDLDRRLEFFYDCR